MERFRLIIDFGSCVRGRIDYFLNDSEAVTGQVHIAFLKFEAQRNSSVAVTVVRPQEEIRRRPTVAIDSESERNLLGKLFFECLVFIRVRATVPNYFGPRIIYII